MFTSALALEKVNQNANLTLTRSEDIFREQCSKLRAHILEYAGQLQDEQKVLNIKKWIEDSNSVWTAVRDNEQLMMITDLKEINDHRALLKALDQFRVIMSKDKP